MPYLSRLMIRAALLWLALGYSIGALMLIEKGLGLWPWMPLWRQAHVQILFVGWFTQLACGVAYWILPRRPQGGERGHPGLMICCALTLNLAVVCAGLAALPGWRSLGLFAATGYALAMGSFVLHAWPRVRPFGSKR